MSNKLIIIAFLIIPIIMPALIGEGLSGPVTLDTVDPRNYNNLSQRR